MQILTNAQLPFEMRRAEDEEEMLFLADQFDYDVFCYEGDTLRLTRELRKYKALLIPLIEDDLPEIRIRHLNGGADFVFAYPFDKRVLLASIEAGIRRIAQSKSSELTFGDYALLREHQILCFKDKGARLTKTEFKLVERLFIRKSCTHGSLFHAMYGADDDPPTDKMINVIVCKVRKKLAEYGIPNCIKTLWGWGYALKVPYD